MLKILKRITCSVIIVAITLLLSINACAEATLTISSVDTITQDGLTQKIRAMFDGENVTENTTWYISQGSLCAFLSSDGTLTPLTDGAVTVTASYVDSEGTQHSASKTITISNQKADTPEANASIMRVGEGEIIRDKGLPTEKNLYSGVIQTYPAGTKFHLTAVEKVASTYTSEFLYWKDVYSGKILSTDKVYEFTLGSNTSIQAVFRTNKNNEAKKLFVMFKNPDGYIIQNETVGTSNITAPQKPTIPGHSFSSWMLDGVSQTLTNNKVDVSTITDDRIYVSSFVQQAALYDVNIVGGSGSGKYKYNDKVVAMLDTASIPEGQYFSCWAKDGYAVSYDEVYTFRVSGNSDLYAVYSTTPPSQKGPSLTMLTPFISGKTITFISERNTPIDYEFIETGILVSMTTSFDLVATGGATLSTSQSTNGSGQFSVRYTKKTSSSTNPVTRYAKAYMIYRKDGIIHTIYSNMASATL